MYELQQGLVQGAAGPREALVHLRVACLHRHRQSHKSVFELAFLGTTAVGLSGELIQPVS